MRLEARVRRVGLLAALVATAWVSACDPCAPTFGCESTPSATLVGQLVDPGSGLPIANASVSARQTGGVALATGSATTTSGSDGSFELSLPANDVGDVVVDVSIQSIGHDVYVVADLPMSATGKAGDATVVPPWVGFTPEFPVVIALRDTLEAAIGNAVVVFRRTGGRRMLAGTTAIDSIRGTTQPDGFLRLLDGITTDTTGEVFGDFVIRLPSGAVRVAGGHSVTALPDFRRPVGFIVLRVIP